MSLPIGRVVVLVRVEIFIRPPGLQLRGRDLGAIGSAKRVGFDDFSSVELKDPLSCEASISRQRKRYAISANRADHRVGDTSVAAGGVQDRFVWGKLAGRLAGDYHRQSGPILDRAARIQMLGLCVNFDIVRKVSSNAPQTDKRRVPYRSFQKCL